jgi:hypothetical protein
MPGDTEVALFGGPPRRGKGGGGAAKNAAAQLLGMAGGPARGAEMSSRVGYESGAGTSSVDAGDEGVPPPPAVGKCVEMRG